MSKKSVYFNHSNLSLVARSKDSNGNPTIKVCFGDGKSFAIQTNRPNFHNTEKILSGLKADSFKEIEELTQEQLDTIEKEVIQYLVPNGTKKQNEQLKIYE